MIALVLTLMALFYVLSRSQAVSLVTNPPAFKYDTDRIAFEQGDIPAHVQDWIIQFNIISLEVSGKRATVTSLVRDDGTFHVGGGAVDMRRLSAANAQDKQPYTVADVHDIEQRAIEQGIPISVQNRGLPSDHFHIGPIHYKGFYDESTE